MSSIYITADGKLENLSLVVEFVIYGENDRASTERERFDKGNQVTVAWT